MKISIVTAYVEDHDPFVKVQRQAIERYTKGVEYEHLRAPAGRQGSRSHGPVLDDLTSRAEGDVIVSLDADAFPVGNWLDWIAEIDTHKAVGIHHPRFGFIHPSFFVVKKKDLNGRSWQRKGDKDVGRVLYEQLSAEGPVLKMEPTSCYAKNPVDRLDPDIGTVYENTVFHNWYTVRARVQNDPDGIPSSLVDDSVQYALRKYKYV